MTNTYRFINLPDHSCLADALRDDMLMVPWAEFCVGRSSIHARVYPIALSGADKSESKCLSP